MHLEWYQHDVVVNELLANLKNVRVCDELNPDFETRVALYVAKRWIKLEESLRLFGHLDLRFHCNTAAIKENDLLSVYVVEQADLEVVERLFYADRHLDTFTAISFGFRWCK